MQIDIQQEVLNSIYTDSNILIGINPYKNIIHLSGICGLGLRNRNHVNGTTKKKKKKKAY